MPIYAYTCPECGKSVEKIRPLKDRDAPVECEVCACKEVSRSTDSFMTAKPSSSSSSSSTDGGSCGSGGFT